MPNWCTNSITIQGPTDTIKQLWEDACNQEDGFGLLNAMHPMPKDLNDTVADGSPMPNWYNWRVTNWGTKWDVSDEGLEFVDNDDGTASIQGWFDSAWSPPIEAYQAFDEQMDNCYITASFYEPGMDFGGFYESEGGEELFEDLSERLKQPTEEWDERFTAFEAEYDLLSEEWRFEEEEA